MAGHPRADAGGLSRRSALAGPHSGRRQLPARRCSAPTRATGRSCRSARCRRSDFLATIDFFVYFHHPPLGRGVRLHDRRGAGERRRRDPAAAFQAAVRGRRRLRRAGRGRRAGTVAAQRSDAFPRAGRARPRPRGRRASAMARTCGGSSADRAAAPAPDRGACRRAQGAGSGGLRERRAQRVLFLSSNGVGMGHLTRLLAIARRCPALARAGVRDHVAGHRSRSRSSAIWSSISRYHAYLGCDVERWNKLPAPGAERADRVLRAARRGVRRSTCPTAVWSTRVRRQSRSACSSGAAAACGGRMPGAKFIERERHFDAVHRAARPRRELRSRADRAVAASAPGWSRRSGCSIEQEMLPREAARARARSGCRTGRRCWCSSAPATTTTISTCACVLALRSCRASATCRSWSPSG